MSYYYIVTLLHNTQGRNLRITIYLFAKNIDEAAENISVRVYNNAQVWINDTRESLEPLEGIGLRTYNYNAFYFKTDNNYLH